MAPFREETEHASGDEAVKEEEEYDEEELSERRNRKRKFKVGEESGLTDAQRRDLRRKQRDLAKNLHEGPIEEDNRDFLHNARKANNELFENVRFTREAVLDAENLISISQKVVKQADEMLSTPRFDAMKLVSKLKSKVTARDSDGNSYFDWYTLGQEASVCFNSLPSRMTFLAGPLEDLECSSSRR